MSTPPVDVVVVGAGLAGSAAAWALARRGVGVQLVESQGLGHRLGSSHGTSRIFRRGYTEADYVTLSGRAQDLWAQLGADHGTPLLRRTGGVDHGSTSHVQAIRTAFNDVGVDHLMLSRDEAEERWPGIRFAGPVLFHPEAGVVSADAAVRAFVDSARARGAEVREQLMVEQLEQVADGVVVHTSEGPVRARRVVVAAGPWVAELLPATIRDRLPGITVTQQQVFHFVRRPPETDWPVVIHSAEEDIYALPSGADGGPEPAYKVAEHERGTPTTARTRDHVVDPASRDRIRSYVERWLPGLVPEVVAETTCLYTTTDDRDFVLDRVGDIVVASPCSGHGAKFAPVIGELLADLALTDTPTVPRFALRPRRPA